VKRSTFCRAGARPGRAVVTLLLWAVLSIAPRAGAEGAHFHPDLVGALDRLDRSKGPESYAAIRGVWRTWDRADPLHVEEALRSTAGSSRLTPPLRVYAALHVAFARTRRGDFESARADIQRLGYVDRWLLVGPFDNEGKHGLEAEHGPEAELGQPIVVGRAYTGKERAVRWRAVPAAFPYGWLDSGALVRPERKVCVFAKTFVRGREGARTPRTITAWIGVEGAFTLFWNGKRLLEDSAYRGHDFDRFATTLTLEPGTNDLTLKLCGNDAPPVVSLRFGDSRGAPDPEIEVTADIAASEEAARLATTLAQRKPAAKPAAGPEGPVQAFERLVKSSRAIDLFAYARYLVATGGDDPTEHRARDLAQRAAEREPTVERLLLAGELSEERNRRREWVAKASALADKAGKPDLAVLLARADLARGSPNWRDAVPFYDRVLAINPDQVDALRGRVELYNEAGLRRTALATLESAVERNPQSVNLLNMYASQLRALGRATDAAEVESRYAGLRFDDRSYLASRIELAISRRNRTAAERWIERLLAADPDSQWALGTAARAYRSLGQTERAIATHQRALELAPEDVGTLRTLADLHAELGRRDEQLALLTRLLQIRPQDRDVREYLEHIEKPKPRPDEAYAWTAKRFLPLRAAAAAGQTQRTLRDLTVTTVFENGLSSKFRQVIYQPLTDAAAAIGRQYAFQYQADREIVQLRGARVYRKNGKIDEAIESGESAANDPSISMYTSARNFYVQLPRLEAGDVVELRYRLDEITPRNEFADYFGEIVHMGSTEPVQNAEYVLITPKSRNFHIEAQVPGLERELSVTSTQRTYRFLARRLAPIAPEPNMPPWAEVLPFIHVSTYATWKDMGRWYWGLAKDQFDLDDETRKLARQIAHDKQTDLDKVKAVYGWVIKNTRYVALEFGIYGYKPRRCVQTVARGWGDCKDKATVIVTLLQELGIPSTIVILRTQMRGAFRGKIPSLAPFDHAIVYVPSLDLYLDGTAEYTGSNELPKMDLESLGLLVNRGDSQLVTLPAADPKKNVIERQVRASVGSDGSAKLELGYVVRGSSAPDWRRRYHAEATRRDRINADLGREFPGFEILPGAAGVTTGDLDDVEHDVSISVRGRAPTFARREGDTLSISVTSDFRLTPSYASLSRRKQDLRILGFSTLDDTFVVKLPPGTKLLSAPAPARGESGFGSYSVSVEQQPGQVTVRSRLELKQSRIRPSEYDAWRKFCAEVDAALGPRLVVSK
jgi:cellulose synthase operon protein C